MKNYFQHLTLKKLGSDCAHVIAITTVVLTTLTCFYKGLNYIYDKRILYIKAKDDEISGVWSSNWEPGHCALDCENEEQEKLPLDNNIIIEITSNKGHLDGFISTENSDKSTYMLFKTMSIQGHRSGNEAVIEVYNIMDRKAIYVADARLKLKDNSLTWDLTRFTPYFKENIFPKKAELLKTNEKEHDFLLPAYKIFLPFITQKPKGLKNDSLEN